MKSARSRRKENRQSKRRGAKSSAAPSTKRVETTAGIGEERGAAVPLLFHLLAAAWVLGMLAFGRVAPDQYYEALQEDRLVEWVTVGLFLAAGLIRLFGAIRTRRIFDALVALFCLFVAGEEFSWGQRLLGFGSPEYFLENNYQQEVNFHNLPQSFVQPKWILMLALAGYGVLLPLIARARLGQRLMRALGASVPPAQLAPWFAAAIALLLWYPLTLTGEWVEFLTGALFLASASVAPKRLWTGLALGVLFGVGMTGVSGAIERGRDVERLKCATAETSALLEDIVAGDAATKKVRGMNSVHKRIWTAGTEGYLERASASRFDAAQCVGSAAQNVGVRRKYGVDPWGTSYWVRFRKVGDAEQRVVVYSFGPNRRRDGKEDSMGEGEVGDDVIVIGSLRRRAE
jgi:hypothetical protein